MSGKKTELRHGCLVTLIEIVRQYIEQQNTPH